MVFWILCSFRNSVLQVTDMVGLREQVMSQALKSLFSVG